MIALHKQAQRAAQWVVDSVMGNGLAQRQNDSSNEGEVAPRTSRLARQAAAEGCVLLTNDGALPLNPIDEVAVFGRCALDWFYMGHGSGGDVHPPYAVNLMEGLNQAGVHYNPLLAQMYRAWCASKEHEADPGWWGHWPTHHPEMPIDLEIAKAAAQTARTAIVVIGRCAGEDLDLSLAPGGYYLTDIEKELLRAVVAAFRSVIVVVNSGNVMDLSWVEDPDTRPSALLLAWQGGMEAGNAVTDVLYGKVNPSGRLTATIARSYDDYPSSASFGGRGVIGYDEGVFAGYRHFDTFFPHGVLFGFGHGLSYTSFEEEILDVELLAEEVVAHVRVTNSGQRAGSRAVLLWCEPPRGEVEKPARVLAAFGKTDELEPDASAEVTLRCDLKTLCAYDTATSSFVLARGGYQFNCTRTATSIEVQEDVVVQRCTPLCVSSAQLRERIMSNLPHEVGAHETDGRDDISFDSVRQGKATIDELVCQLSDNELEALSCGEGAMNSQFGAPGNAGAFGGVTPALRERGIPAAVCADGPSGARLQRKSSLLPCATALACSWNTGLVEALYGCVAAELRESNVDVLLAPGMNIQRDPRCGRNFEYFSEDPLVSGKMAAAVVRGLQGVGVSACPKHFACNNQEARRNTSDSRVSEQALRQIYLRGFEICVREARPRLIMTSYNKVNGVWAHYHYDLATTVLREDWGYEGVVITDWWMQPARSPEFPSLRNNAYRIRAGVDVLMPGSMSHVLSVRQKPTGISRAELQRTARRVLTFLLG